MAIPIRIGVRHYSANLGTHSHACPSCGVTGPATVVREYERFDLWGIPLLSKRLTYAYRCTACGSAAFGPRPSGVSPPPVTHRFGVLIFFATPVAMWFAYDAVETKLREARWKAAQEEMRPVEERMAQLRARQTSIAEAYRKSLMRCYDMGTEVSKQCSNALPEQAPAEPAALLNATVMSFVPSVLIGTRYFGPHLDDCQKRYPTPPAMFFPSSAYGEGVGGALDTIEHDLNELERKLPPLPPVIVDVQRNSDKETGKLYLVAAWMRTADSVVLARVVSDAAWSSNDPDLTSSLLRKIGKW